MSGETLHRVMFEGKFTRWVIRPGRVAAIHLLQIEYNQAELLTLIEELMAIRERTMPERTEQ